MIAPVKCHLRKVQSGQLAPSNQFSKQPFGILPTNRQYGKFCFKAVGVTCQFTRKLRAGFKINVIDCLSQNSTQQRHSSEAFVCVLQSQLLTHVGQLNVMNPHCEFSTRIDTPRVYTFKFWKTGTFISAECVLPSLHEITPCPSMNSPRSIGPPALTQSCRHRYRSFVGRQSFPRPMATESSIFDLLWP